MSMHGIILRVIASVAAGGGAERRAPALRNNESLGSAVGPPMRLGFRRLGLFIPEGWLRIARRFNAGFEVGEE